MEGMQTQQPPSETAAETAAPDRAALLESRFAGPVVVAALASVPATFLTMLEGPAGQVGAVVNWASLAVLTAESLVLLVLASDRLAWIKRHWFMIGIAVAAIPAVLFAFGPVQVLRALRVVGAVRIVRARRILRAGKILRHRAGLRGPVARVTGVGVSMACAAFVVMVLSDPTSFTRRILDDGMQKYGIAAILLAGAILGGATYVVRRTRSRVRSEQDRELA